MSWVESEHPRNRLGQFTGKGGWAGRALRRMGIVDQQADELRDFMSGARETNVPRVLAGGNSSMTERRRMRGRDGVERDIVTKYGGRVDHSHEVRVSAIGRAIGAPVPVVIHDEDNPRSIHMPFVHGETPFQVAIRELSERDGVEYGYNDPQVWTRGDLVEQRLMGNPGALHLGLLDMLVGNRDRHPGNAIITPDGTVVGIDHSSSDLGSGSINLSQSSPYARLWFENGYLRTDILHPQDVPTMRQNLADLDLPRGLREQLLERFDMIATGASGTQRWLDLSGAPAASGGMPRG